MRFKFGPSSGNSGAIVRWGTYLDNGMWIRGWNFRRLWFRWRFRRGYADLGFVVFHWGN